MKILFTNAGRRTYMVQFALELQQAGYPLDVHVSDCSPFSAVMHVSPVVHAHVLPPALKDPGIYWESFQELISREAIDVVFPLMDFDALYLAQHRHELAKIGCTAVVSAPETVERCNNKGLMFQFCRNAGLATPQCWFEPEAFNGSYPVLQKQILGYGSSGMRRIESAGDLSGFLPGRDMLQELIQGDEFGLDVLNDLDGRFVAVCVKRKLLMRAGETDKAQIVEDEELSALGRRISESLRHVGNLDCDILRDAEGILYCIDFNPRFGGGYHATHVAGFNYLKALLDMTRGKAPVLPRKPLPVTVMKGISLHWCETPGHSVEGPKVDEMLLHRSPKGF